MEHRSIFAQPNITRLQQLLAEVRRGMILIPKFQRPFEWDKQRRLLLLDSIVKGVPIGSILVWRTSTQELDCFEKLGPFPLLERPETKPQHYLIDGHQRLTTLYATLSPFDDIEPVDGEDEWPIYYDLDAPAGELAFTTLRKKQSKRPTLLPARALLTPKLMWKAQKQLYDDKNPEAAERAEELANIFKDYQIPVLPLVTEDMNIVTDAFVRINSGGKKMAETHMVQALAYSRFPMRDRSQAVRDKLAPLGWGELDDRVILNALKVRWDVDIYGARPELIVSHFKAEKRDDETDEQVFERIFSELETHIEAVIKLLRRCEVWGPASLPYMFQFVALAEARRQLGSDEAFFAASDALVRWFWLTTFTDYFTGMNSNMIRAATEHVFEVAQGAAESLPGQTELSMPPLRRHNFAAVRTKARVLFMLRQIEDQGVHDARARLVGMSGANALPKIEAKMPDSRPGARIIADSTELVRVRAALEDPANPERAKILAEHVIDQPAAQALEAGDIPGFLDAREQLLEGLENEFLAELWPS